MSVMLPEQHKSVLVTHPTPNIEHCMPTDPVHISEYNTYLQDYFTAANQTLMLDYSLLQKYGIALTRSVLPQTSHELPYRQPKIIAMHVRDHASIITYMVMVGAYAVRVRMLNLDDRKFDQGITQGAFGSIVALADQHEQFVAKRIPFQGSLRLMREDPHQWKVQARFQQVKTVLFEYALAKICSMLKVGARVKLDIGFDVVCYRNCIEFYMQRCQSLETTVRCANRERVENRLKWCLAVMHAHRLVHRDIKPGNVVYSPTIGDYVLCDFGITLPQLTPSGFESESYREGTPNYMCPQLRAISDNEKGLVDLYYNDVYALKKTVSYWDILVRNSYNKSQPILVEPTSHVLFLKGLSRALKQSNSLDRFISLEREQRSAEFLLSSFSVSPELQVLLQQFQPTDDRSRKLLQRVNAAISVPNFVRSHYQDMLWIPHSMHPLNFMAVRMRELQRLQAAEKLNRADQRRKWKIVVEIMEVKASVRRKFPQAKAMLEALRVYKLHPEQQAIEQDMVALSKAISSQQKPMSMDEVSDLLRNCSNQARNTASILFTDKGDHLAGFYALLTIDQPPAEGYCRQLSNIFRFYVRLPLKNWTILRPIELERVFIRMKVDPKGWHWLKQLILLAMSLVYFKPGQCIALLKTYLPQIERSHWWCFCAVIGVAYNNLHDWSSAEQWFTEQLKLMEIHEGNGLRLICTRKSFVELKANIPNANLQPLIVEMDELIEQLHQLSEPNPWHVVWWHFRAEMYLKCGDTVQAMKYFSGELERTLRRMDAPQLLLLFHSKAIELSRTLLTVNTVGKSLIEKRADTSVEMCTTMNRSGIRPSQYHNFLEGAIILYEALGNTQKAEWLLQMLTFEPLTIPGDVVTSCENILKAYFKTGKYESARSLLIWFIENFKGGETNTRACFIKKLRLVLDYARKLDLDKALTEMLNSQTTNKSAQSPQDQAKVRIALMLEVVKDPDTPYRSKVRGSLCWNVLCENLIVLSGETAVAHFQLAFDTYKQANASFVRQCVIRIQSRLPISSEGPDFKALICLYESLCKVGGTWKQHMQAAYSERMLRKRLYYLQRAAPAPHVNHLGMLCETYAYLRMSRAYYRTLHAFLQQQPLERPFEELASFLERTGQWARYVVTVGAPPKKCPKAITTRLRLLKEGNAMQLPTDSRQICRVLELAKGIVKEGLSMSSKLIDSYFRPSKSLIADFRLMKV